ncbi:hypothetical protein K4L06_17300 [Lysobacter sp. BMK333-48F3]|uniref:hypothetical protein n=1 Tax=Lysobacter sp. BMK333-48F3 TaxID=2867962 RepID=UPI001C8CBCE9|nr:hypothetical protein [Lysobacter sp. BMK333-48F3]MBX9403068.1 hypothetical protein [Lysobacter sp. BMK333-48F3]
MERQGLDRSPLRAAPAANPFAPPLRDTQETPVEPPQPYIPLPRSQIQSDPIDGRLPPLAPPTLFGGRRFAPSLSLVPPLQLPRLPAVAPAPAAKDALPEGPVPLPPLRLPADFLRPAPGPDPNALIDWRSIRQHYNLRGVPFGAGDGDSFVAEYRRIDQMYRTLGFDRDMRLGPFKLDRNSIINLGLGMQAEHMTSRDSPNFMDRDAAMRKLFYPDEKRFVFSFPSIRF